MTNCKRCLHPQWTHSMFDGIGECLAVIHPDPNNYTETETPDGITIEWKDNVLHCSCQAFVQP